LRRTDRRFALGLADDADDTEVRRLLRERPLPGAIAVTFEREPDASLAASIEGDVHQTLVARYGARRVLAGVAARSVRTVFVNGAATRLGYLGQLRMTGGMGLRTLIDEGFAFCRTLHQQGDAPAYLMSVATGNNAAQRLLDRETANTPRYLALGDMDSFVIPARRRRSRPGGTTVQVTRGSQSALAGIVACLQRNLQRYQLAPRWTASDLESGVTTRGLSLNDFVVAVENGHVVGCAALWDQRAFKQVVVRGYQPTLRRARPLLNLAARLTGLPRLPAPGERLDFAYLSHIAIDDDRSDVLAVLVDAQIRSARERGLEYLVAGFHQDHPFNAVVRARWAWRTYRTRLSLAYWPDGAAFVRSLDDRPPQPEVAVL
jgi:hypothetical protein